MLTEEMSSIEIGRARQAKGWRATLVRLLLVAFLAGLCTLVYGHTTAHGDGPAARVAPLQSTPQPTATPQQPTVALPLAQDIELLKVKVESELEASRKGIEAMREANDQNFLLFAVISGFVGLFGIVTWVTTLLKEKREHRDYNIERGLYEKRAQAYENRRQEEHDAVLKLFDEQFKARQGENQRAGAMFALQEANLEQVNKITTVIAAGAKQNVESLNAILATFQEIMEFRVEEAEATRELMEQMKGQLAELEEAQRQQVEELRQSAERLRRPRHVCASPDPDLQRRMVEFRTQMDLVQRVVLDRHTGVTSPAQNRRYGEIYLRRGIIAYYDNDVVKAGEMLRLAARFFPVPVSDQEIQGMPPDERFPTAFAQYYLALIEKNYGDMKKARVHIDNSYAVYGQNESEELLTPVVRAEILSYLGDMTKAREAIREVLERADALRRRGDLKRHDAAYALRAQLLLGNTYYVEGEWQGALTHFQKALDADKRRDNTYYAYNSIAQVHRKLGNKKEAQENQRRAYQELLDTGHLRTKVALDTRILLNALAYLCARDDDPDKTRYWETIQDLWLRIHEANGLELRLFSLEKKQQVSKEDFWKEIFGPTVEEGKPASAGVQQEQVPD